MPRLPGSPFKFIQKQRCSCRAKKTEKVFEFSHKIHKENNCRVSFLKFIKKETSVQLLPCEFCEISENTFFTEHLLIFLLFFY